LKVASFQSIEEKIATQTIAEKMLTAMHAAP
jgi:hypothetical protein